MKPHEPVLTAEQKEQCQKFVSKICNEISDHANAERVLYRQILYCEIIEKMQCMLESLDDEAVL